MVESEKLKQRYKIELKKEEEETREGSTKEVFVIILSLNENDSRSHSIIPYCKLKCIFSAHGIIQILETSRVAEEY